MADKLLKSLDFGTGDKYYPSTKWENVEDAPTIPTKTSELTNDSNFLTSSDLTSHNTSNDSHNDIRLLIEGLTTRLNALANSDDTTLDQMAEIVAYIKNNKSLIDSITTSKVNVTDIIDNLTTSVTNKPLSAKQGVVLKELIDTLTSVVNGKAPEEHTHSQYLTEVPSEYVTESELTAKGYATQESVDELSEEKVDLNQGSENVGKILIVGADGNLTLSDIPQSVSGDIVGIIDENNNIVLTGDLDNGTYTFKYENADGTYADIGSLTIANVDTGGETSYTNLANPSDASWLNDTRFSTSTAGNTSAFEGMVVTNYIRCSGQTTLRAKGLDFANIWTGKHAPMFVRYTDVGSVSNHNHLLYENGTYDENTNISTCDISGAVLNGEYFRFSANLVEGYTAEDVIITLDEEIV